MLSINNLQLDRMQSHRQEKEDTYDCMHVLNDLMHPLLGFYSAEALLL